MSSPSELASKIGALGNILASLPHRDSFHHKLQKCLDRKKNKTVVQPTEETRYSLGGSYNLNSIRNVRS